MKDFITYKEIKEALCAAGIEDARYETDVLISHFCSVSPATLPLMKNEKFDSPELISAVRKRCERYPLQYLIGSWGFCNEIYRVSPDCLIPRPETELLVELAQKNLPAGGEFLDLCTGSGCIAVSTLAARPDCRAVAVDLFDGTLALARENAQSNEVFKRASFVKCDVLSPDAASCICGERKFDALLSNPPYIKTEDIASLEPELFSEPLAALDGGDDGLIFYRAIISGFADRLNDGGFMLFEAGADTARGVAELGEAAGFSSEVIADLSGIDRMIFLKKRT